ncbi:hypothetical protein BH23GEM3_BH23GEM3_24220 [soil metagenome]|nr:hypothetical protein [Gemmatimonadota bacterium]
MDRQENGWDRERASHDTREPRGVLERAKDGVVAGASSVAGFTKTIASETVEKATRAADFVRESETDAELKSMVASTTEQKLHQAGDRLSGAAPAIGRGAERAAEAVGAALHLVAAPLATILGAIAGVLGGWWNKAAAAGPELPEAEEDACRAHFATITVIPAEMTYDRARTGYALGYIAARNPAYRGRGFDDVEPDLRQGFRDVRTAEYDSLRDFARFGYGRGAGTGL